MNSEQVAQVLRQSGSQVRLIVARPVIEPPAMQIPHAPIVPTHQLDEHLKQINALLDTTEAIPDPHQQLPPGMGMDGIVQVHHVCIGLVNINVLDWSISVLILAFDGCFICRFKVGFFILGQ